MKFIKNNLENKLKKENIPNIYKSPGYFVSQYVPRRSFWQPYTSTKIFIDKKY